MSSKGPVITPELLESVVNSKEFYLHPGSTTMTCALKLTNGFVVTGQSASIPTTEFNPTIGMKYAESDAMSKIAELVGFLVYEFTTESGRVSVPVLDALTKLKELENGH